MLSLPDAAKSVLSGRELAWRLLAKMHQSEEATMNDISAEPEARVELVLAAVDLQASEWAGVLDCGALGPGQEEPALFYQRANDSDAS
jgi:hypothetical protein